MNIFIVATFSEAKALINKFKLTLKEKKPFFIYEKDSIVLCISGIGKINSAIASTYTIKKYKKINSIINFGICGSSDTKKRIGSLYKIKTIIDKDNDKKFIAADSGEKLLCFSKPIEKLDTLALVDMESSGFYNAAKFFIDIKKIALYKIVSDYLDIDIPNKDFIYKITEKNIGEIFESIGKWS